MPTPDPSTFQAAYGPYAFGVGAFALIIAVLIVCWKLVVVPALVQLAAIAKHQADTAQAMKDTTEAAERIIASCTCRGPHAPAPDRV